MPNLKYFMYFSMYVDDEIFEDFISSTLPSLKNLTDFRILIPHSKVTDSSVKRMFNSFPQEWFSRLTVFKVVLVDTNITDNCLREFIDETLRKFKVLEHFNLQTSSSLWTVSSHMRKKNFQVGRIFLKKNKFELMISNSNIGKFILLFMISSSSVHIEVYNE